MDEPRVSVVLPTLDGRRDLEELLPALAAQRVPGGHELLVVDSSSTDGTRELCEAAGASVRVIPRAEFRHGATRNLRARDARGAFLVFLTQDALPRGEDFLSALTAPLEDPEVVGTWARILPRPSDDPLTARTALAQPEAAEQGYAVHGDATWRALPVEQRLARVRFNNVASAMRRDAFERAPFPDVPFGEDLAWALAALDAGGTLRFVPEAVVWHAHRYSPRAAFERNRVDAAFQRTRFDRRVRPGVLAVLRGLGHELREDARYVLGRGPRAWAHLARAPFLRGAQVLGQLCGTRGWNPLREDSATGRLS